MESLWIYILPEHVWKAADNAHWGTYVPPVPLVGSGPYTVTTWHANGTTVLERNRFFRGETTSGPERVLMTFYRDKNRAVTDLAQNRLDVLPSDTADGSDVKRLERTSGVRVYQSPAIGFEYWVFNMARRVNSRVHKSVVQSKAIRQALAWAIDRTKLVQASLLGYGAPGNTQLSRNYGRFRLDLSTDPVLGYTYDPGRARQILDAAGWRVGAGGIRSKNGVRASFELAYAGGPTDKRAVALIRAWARDVGVEIHARVDSAKNLLALAFNKQNKKLTPAFDSELWSIGGDPTPEFLLSLFTKAQLGIWNDSGWVNATYERLFRQETRTLDKAARVDDIHRLQRIAAVNLPYIELYEPDELSAVNTRTWQNWTTQPSSNGQPLTSYGYSTIVALRPGTPRSYPGVWWALAALVAVTAAVLASSLLAHRREQREPIEIADAPA
jgi:peptide/nickel transport system substrate-binding protein